MSSKTFDVLVIGGGPGGSTAATLLARKGFRVGLIERETFPRFKIGESLLPYSMDILKESGVFEKIDSGKYIRKYGASFIDHREEDQVYFEFLNGLDRDHPYAFEVQRHEFDKDLLDHAKEWGVEVFQPLTADEVIFHDSHVEVRTQDGFFSAKYLIDASGRKALIGSQLKNRSSNRHFINNMAVFSHYKNVKRHTQKKEGDIIIGILPENAWSWHIPFQGEITSVGIVCKPETYHKAKDSNDFIVEWMQCHPIFKDIMSEAVRLKDLEVVSNYSYGNKEKIGKRWIAIGDAATFLDPVFSSGVHISLTSARLSSQILTEALSADKDLTDTDSGQRYTDTLLLGVGRFQSLLLLFYNTSFIRHMKKAQMKKSLFASFTSAIGGDMWNDENLLFRMGILSENSQHNEAARTL